MHQARFDQSQDRGTNITIHDQLTEPGEDMVKLLVSCVVGDRRSAQKRTVRGIHAREWMLRTAVPWEAPKDGMHPAEEEGFRRRIRTAPAPAVPDCHFFSLGFLYLHGEHTQIASTDISHVRKASLHFSHPQMTVSSHHYTITP